MIYSSLIYLRFAFARARFIAPRKFSDICISVAAGFILANMTGGKCVFVLYIGIEIREAILNLMRCIYAC